MSERGYVEEKIWQILYIAGKDDQMATSSSLLDIMHQSDGFNANLIEPIN